MRTIWLTILLAGCGEAPTSEETTTAPAEEKGGTPAEATEPKAADEATETPPNTEPALPSTLVDAQGAVIGTMDADQVIVQGQRLDVDLHQGFAPSSSQATCYFKLAACKGDCYTTSNETAIVLDKETLVIASPDLKKDITIGAAGVDLPWLSQTSPKGCIESERAKSTAAAKLFIAKPVNYELPFALEK